MGDEILSIYETSEIQALSQRNGPSIDIGTIMCAKIFFTFSDTLSILPRDINNCKNYMRQVCTNPELQVTRQAKCCIVASNICWF